MNKKFLNFILAFGTIVGLPFIVYAQTATTVQILGESTNNPAPGSTMYVTVGVCDNLNYSLNPDQRPDLMAAIVTGSNQTSLNTNCAAAGQYLVMDSNIPGSIASGPGTYDPDLGNNAKGVSTVYSGYNNPGNGSCASNGSVTAILPIYIDGNVLTPGGSYSFVLIASEDYVSCSSAIQSSAAFNFSLQLPLPSCTITKSAEATTAAPDGLILFKMDYSFVNTTSFVITDTVPLNTTFVSASPGGTPSGSNLTWNLYSGAGTTQQTGEVWLLVSVNPGDTAGMVITNSAVATAAGASSGPVTSTATSTIQIPQLTLTKSQSPSPSVAANTNLTYYLAWTATNESLQVFDSYDYDPSGTATSDGSNVTGFDGTGYTVLPNSVTSETWSVNTDSQGNHYISSTVPFFSNGGNYPLLLRNSPSLDICQGVTVEGDLQIPSTATGALSANGSGADDTMVVAYNVTAGVTQAYMVGISLDSGPGNLFLQKNNGTNVSDPAHANDKGTGSLPVSITPDTWYRVEVAITQSGTGLLIQAKVWQEGTAEPVTWPISYTDATPFPCGETWQQGWQADASSGTDYFSNLQIIGPGPIVNPKIFDGVPSGISYGGSSSTTLTGAPSLSWSFPGTFLAQTPPLSWFGQVSCPGPINNQFTMTANNFPTTFTSNTVSDTVTGSCITSTPTNTPTNTLTPTPTVSCALLSATLSWASDDAGEIFINGNLANLCGNGCWVGTNNISIPTGWINTTGDNVLAAYSYSTDTIFSAATWLLTLTYSNCANSYVLPGPCVLDQYLNDPNSATGLPSAGSFPANWNIVSFNDSSWSAPGTIGTILPGIASADELIPNPLGGTVPWTWGAANWLTVNVGDGYMLREHFQVGTNVCAPNTPTNTPTATPTQTLTPTITPTITIPAGLHVWPNPFNPQYAWPGNGVGLFRAYMVPSGATMSIYTVSGELVVKLGEDQPGYIDWNGKNTKGIPVSAGVYYYVIQNNNSKLLSGKVLVLRD